MQILRERFIDHLLLRLLPVHRTSNMGLVSLIVFFGFAGKLTVTPTPVKFVFDVDQSEIREDASERGQKALMTSEPNISMERNERMEMIASVRGGNNEGEMPDRSGQWAVDTQNIFTSH